MNVRNTSSDIRWKVHLFVVGGINLESYLTQGERYHTNWCALDVDSFPKLRFRLKCFRRRSSGALHVPARSRTFRFVRVSYLWDAVDRESGEKISRGAFNESLLFSGAAASAQISRVPWKHSPEEWSRDFGA